MFFLGLTGTAFLLDWGAKELIEGTREEEFPIEVKKSKGKLFLYKNYNSGLPFGFLKEYPQVVQILPLMVLSALTGAFAWVLTKKGYLAEKFALALAIGGGMSNLYDRLKRHKVVDYLNVRWSFMEKVIFNLGDFFIVFGFLIILVKELMGLIKKR